MTDTTPSPHTPSPILDEACDKAVAYHRAGELHAAERLYRAILQTAPAHPAANHLLGLLNVQRQQPEAGLPHLLTALEATPQEAEYWLAYLDALLLAGRTEEARQVMAIGRQHGLAGDAVEDLARRLPKEPPPVDTPKTMTTPAKESKATKQASRRTPRPSADEENALVTLYNQERYEEGMALAREMTARFPQHGFGWKVLGALLRSQGNSTDALIPLQRSAQLEPHDAQAQSNLGLVLADLNRLPESEACHRNALAINPHVAETLNNLGTTLKLQGRLAEAEACYRRAINLKTGYAEAQNNLGVTLFEQRRFAEAEAAYRIALTIDPAYAEAANNLGNLLGNLHRPKEAWGYLKHALDCKPDFVDAHYNLANVLRELGRLDEAVQSFRQALMLKPNFAEAHLNLGVTLNDSGLLNEAESSYRAALASNSTYSEAFNNLGNTLRELGRLSEADACYREALSIKPDYPEAHSNLLFNHCCAATLTPTEYLQEALQYRSILESMTSTRYSSWRCATAPARLRVGIVSGDLRNHPVGYFLECLLSHIDQARIELIAYPTNHSSDDLSKRVAPYFSEWKPLTDHSDADAAGIIHADGIHVLIDAAGHTAGNRLPVFAYKPAPIQATWLGYFASTGVAEIDYLLCDDHVVPEREEDHFSEKIWRLADSYLCFTQPDIPLDVSTLPALSSDHITFACFNNLAKINDAVVGLWARILNAIPNSRLFLKTKQLGNPHACTAIQRRFATHGISADRLILEGSSPRGELLAAYRRADIALDPFPYPGGTTSVEAIWMGIPFITLRGDRFLSHMGESIAHNAGLSDWIALDKDDYVAKAITHSSDLPRLEILRSKLRRQALDSPLFNAAQFSRNFEEALWGMWQRRQQQQGISQ